MTTTAPAPDRVQRHVVRTLSASQILGGVGMSAGWRSVPCSPRTCSGSAELAGLGGTFQVLGGALIAIPMARIMARARSPARAW